MSSSSSPKGRHRAPRKGGRVLTGRRIRVAATRRTEIDVHHLARALLRLAQDRYDANPALPGVPESLAPEKPSVRPHEPHTGPNGHPWGNAPTAPPGRTEGAAG